jgi:PTS system nitrogen regulatory IIA component
MKLQNYLDSRCINFVQSDNREIILDGLIEASYQAGKFPDHENFRRAIHEREGIISTGIGLGVAVPHVKLPNVPEFFISIGISQSGIEWNAFDQKPVHFVFLIGGPAERQTDYLKILAKLVLLAKNPKLRESLLVAADATEVMDIFSNLG